jgi:hypothetical protein
MTVVKCWFPVVKKLRKFRLWEKITAAEGWQHLDLIQVKAQERVSRY